MSSSYRNEFIFVVYLFIKNVSVMITNTLNWRIELLNLHSGTARPNISQLLAVCASLSSSRLILTEHGRNDIRQKIRLNISIDDVTYALKSC